MFESWTVNAFIISNILTIILVVVTFLIYKAGEKRNLNKSEPET
jgi:hypothetical protein